VAHQRRPTWARWGRCCRPGGLVFAAGKSGLGYLLRADHLGGVGGQLVERPVRASAPVGQASRFATPTLAGGLVLVGTLTGVVALTPRP
jgi:hypothetical protein